MANRRNDIIKEAAHLFRTQGYLQTTVLGRYFYLYMIEDIYSRKIVGWEVHLAESHYLLFR